MGYHTLFAMLVTITAIASYTNHKYLQLPKTIGLTIISILVSLCVMAAFKIVPDFFEPVHELLSGIDFKNLVLEGLLSYLLFAGALHVNVVDLRKQFIAVLSMASFGVIISTFLTAYVLWLISNALGLNIPFSYCLIFGAVISPTDPIAVLSVFKVCKNIPTKMKMRITGEAMFNDAAAILLFVIIVSIMFSSGDAHLTAWDISWELIREAAGGVLAGVIFAGVACWFLSRCDDAEVAILITLAVTSTGFIIANNLHVSAPLAMVVAGIIIGNNFNKTRFSQRTIVALDNFWRLIDEVLNAFLFVLIGLEVLTMHFDWMAIPAGIVAMIVIIAVRLLSIAIPMIFIERNVGREYWKGNAVMCWGGLRGGISIALALSIPNAPEIVVTVTYIVVLLSILLQGSTFKLLVNKLYPPKPFKETALASHEK
jgi:CPA1 family monovalent cation:H+ antiporter